MATPVRIKELRGFCLGGHAAKRSGCDGDMPRQSRRWVAVQRPPGKCRSTSHHGPIEGGSGDMPPATSGFPRQSPGVNSASRGEPGDNGPQRHVSETFDITTPTSATPTTLSPGGVGRRWTREVHLTSDRERVNAHHVPAARRWFRRLPFPPTAASALDDAETCLSEVLTNSLRHSMSPHMRDHPIHITVIDGGDAIRVEVVDQPSILAPAPGMLRRAAVPSTRPTDTYAPGGRGLIIVEALSYACGVDDTHAGRCTWFEVPYRPKPATA